MTNNLNHFVVVALCVCLWLLLTLSSVELGVVISDTVYVVNGTESVDLSCGEVPDNANAIEWFMYRSGKNIKIFKYYHKTPGRIPKYYSGCTAEKYDISHSGNPSMVLKNIKLADVDHYICVAIMGVGSHMHTTLLQVVGKSLLVTFSA